MSEHLTGDPSIVKKKFFNPFPKHLQVREILLRRIAREYETGERFPTEKALCEEFSLSRETIREALGSLEREGYLTRKQGVGTFVCGKPKDEPDARLTGFIEDYSELRLNTTSSIVEHSRVTASLDVRKLFNSNTQLYRIKRLRDFDGAPLSLHESYFPAEYSTHMLKIAKQGKWLVSELSKYLNAPIFERQHKIEAISADTAEAPLLQVALGAPLLLITKQYVGKGGDVILVSQSRYRSDRYYYTVKLDA